MISRTRLARYCYSSWLTKSRLPTDCGRLYAYNGCSLTLSEDIGVANYVHRAIYGKYCKDSVKLR